MYLGFESLIYGYDSSSGDEVVDYAKTAQLYDELYSAEFCCSHMIYAMENVEAIRRVVRRYGITQSLEYLFGENDIPSMESDNWFVRMWNAIVRYLKIFWDWIVSLFNNTKKIQEKLLDAEKNLLDKITYPVTINGVIETDVLHHGIVQLDNYRKWLKNASLMDFEFGEHDNAGQEYDVDRGASKEAYKPGSVTFNSISDIKSSITVHSSIIAGAQDVMAAVKTLRDKFKAEIRTAKETQYIKVKSNYMKGILNAIRNTRYDLNKFCASTRALLHGINKAAKKGR